MRYTTELVVRVLMGFLIAHSLMVVSVSNMTMNEEDIMTADQEGWNWTGSYSVFRNTEFSIEVKSNVSIVLSVSFLPVGGNWSTVANSSVPYTPRSSGQVEHLFRSSGLVLVTLSRTDNSSASGVVWYGLSARPTFVPEELLQTSALLVGAAISIAFASSALRFLLASVLSRYLGQEFQMVFRYLARREVSPVITMAIHVLVLTTTVDLLKLRDYAPLLETRKLLVTPLSNFNMLFSVAFIALTLYYFSTEWRDPRWLWTAPSGREHEFLTLAVVLTTAIFSMALEYVTFYSVFALWLELGVVAVPLASELAVALALSLLVSSQLLVLTYLLTRSTELSAVVVMALMFLVEKTLSTSLLPFPATIPAVIAETRWPAHVVLSCLSLVVMLPLNFKLYQGLEVMS